MPMFKTCTACKETFIAESPFIKLCPICNAKSQTTPAERAQRKTRITPDRLIPLYKERLVPESHSRRTAPARETQAGI